MLNLSSGYSADVDSVDKDSWSEVLQKFDDANIYQTWSYDAIKVGADNTSHLILRRDGAIVSAAQVRIVKTAFMNTGIAYVCWGPLWRLSGDATNAEVFRQAIRALLNEYVCRRGLVLRLLPVLFSDDRDTFLPIFEQEGFVRAAKADSGRTLLIDLGPSLEELRKGLEQKWRNCLNRAEKNELELVEGYDDQLYGMFLGIYREMLGRKRFAETRDMDELRLIQKGLPDRHKMRIMLCRSSGEVCAGAICSAIGKTALYLAGATSNSGMKTKGSYLIQWRTIEWLKQRQCSWYDLNGINPETNPGTYRFKAGLCGKNGKEVRFLGQFDAYKNPLSLFVVRCGDVFISNYRKTKGVIRGLRHSKG